MGRRVQGRKTDPGLGCEGQGWTGKGQLPTVRKGGGGRGMQQGDRVEEREGGGERDGKKGTEREAETEQRGERHPRFRRKAERGEVQIKGDQCL